MSARYEISIDELGCRAELTSETITCVMHFARQGGNLQERIADAVIRQQSADIAELRAELAAVVAERDRLHAFKQAVDSAPTIAHLYKFPYLGGFVWCHSSYEFNGAKAIESIELIAKPAKD